MTFITFDDYALYDGEEIPAEEFGRYAARASEAVDAACRCQISLRGLDDFGEFDQRQIKLATCAQAENLYFNGIETALSGGAGSGGYHIGKASITGVSGGAAGTGSSSGLCPKAYHALWITGLMYAGVAAKC